MAPIERQHLKRRWILFLLALGFAALCAISLTQDFYGHGHSPIFGKWHYWSFGLREGNLFVDLSDGEGNIFGDMAQLINGTHAPMLGSVPSFQWHPPNVATSGPVWLPMLAAVGVVAWRQAAWRSNKSIPELETLNV
jgi:hypothetical protein